MAPRVLAVIPARGGSKGIPRKNLCLIGGIPLIGRAVLAACRAERVNRVVVSSDDDEILAVGARFGATPVRRPAEFATDIASSEDALIHVIEALAATGDNYDVLVFLQCTSPFITPDHVDQLAAAILDRSELKAALTVSNSHAFIWRADANGIGYGVNHDHTQPRQRRQDLLPEYRENGAGYAMDVSAFLQQRTRFCGPVGLVKTDIPPVEIDSMEDLLEVEALHTVMNRNHEAEGRFRQAAAKVKVLVTDFDGVHTDDRVYVFDDGREAVLCSRSDGLGVSMLREAGLSLLILSRETNQVVARRAAKLGVEVIQGVGQKLTVLEDWLTANRLEFKDIAYLGNDVNDLECMARATIAFAPSDASEAAKSVATLVLDRDGGNGAVRAACDALMAARG